MATQEKPGPKYTSNVRVMSSQRKNKIEKSPKFRMAILATVSISIKAFYKGQFEALNEAGIKTTVICADDADLTSFLPDETNFIPVDFTRVLNPLKDLKVLYQLFRIFRKEKFNLVQYSTPRAALLGSIASFSARVPIRIYLLWGLYYEGQRGIKKRIFKLFEKTTCLLSTCVLPNSHEMVEIVEQQGLAKKSKCEVILNGSACGADLEEFNPEKWKHSRKQMRGRLKIPQDGIVIGVFGRLTGDKGVNEIVAAFRKMSQELDNVFLLVVGRQEEKDKLLPETEEIIKTHPQIRTLGWQKTLLPCYATIDIFCLPSYREGFPQSPLEAQAMKLPVVCTNVMGSREAIVNNQTGFLAKPRSSKALVEPLKKLILDLQLRKTMGQKGRKRVEQMFDRKDMVQAMVEHRLKLLSSIERTF